MPKEDGWKNLKHFTSDQDIEKQREYGRKGGIKSGEVRKRKADLRKALDTLLSLEPTGKLKNQLEQMGYSMEGMNNADALVATLFAEAIRGDKKAAEMLMQYNFQASDDDRKTRESDARINAMRDKGIDAVTSSDGDDGDVLIYLPEIEKTEENEEKKEDNT